MKKIISIMLALVLVLSMGTVALAADDATGDAGTTTTVTYAPTDEKTFNEITKTYTSENGVAVNETLSFTSTPDANNPENKNLTVDNLVVVNNAGTLAVTIPSLGTAGEYEWVITENEGSTAGVVYSKDEVHVRVIVGYDNDNHKLVILNEDSYIKKATDGSKAKTYTNFFKSGSFTVAKEVTGNMANENDKFEITVTLTSDKPIGTNVSLAGTTVTPNQWVKTEGKDEWTATSTLQYSKADGSKTFSDIPVGVTVTVTEDTADAKMNGYSFVGINGGTNGFTKTITDEDSNTPIVVTNNKTTAVDMGVALDSMPYVLMLVVVAAGLFVLISKKRAAREN